MFAAHNAMFCGVKSSPDPSTVTATITTGYIYAAAIAANGNTLFTANEDSTITPINTATNSAGTNINSGAPCPYMIATSPSDSTKFYTVSGGGILHVYSTTTNAFTGWVYLSGAPETPVGLAVSPNGNYVYASDLTNRMVNTYTAALGTSSTGYISGTYATFTARGIAFSPNSSKAYIAHGTNRISVCNTSTNDITATITLTGASIPYGLAVSPDSTKLYCTDIGNNYLHVIDASTNTQITSVAVGTYPNSATVSPDGSKVYVANRSSNSVSVINAGTNTVTRTITVGTSPRTVSVTPDGSKLFVANYTGQSVSVVT